jgi:hypothetical protein
VKFSGQFRIMRIDPSLALFMIFAEGVYSIVINTGICALISRRLFGFRLERWKLIPTVRKA